jgi:hypothetical protein
MKAGPPPEELREQKPKTATKATAKRPTAPRRNLEQELGQMLVMTNLFAAPFIGNDALDDAEILVLARGMNEQAQKSPRFRRLIEGALGATGASGLIGVVVIIAARRAARHNMIEPAWDQRLEAMLRLQLMDIDPTDPSALAAAAAVAAAMTEPPNAPESNGAGASQPAQ